MDHTQEELETIKKYQDSIDNDVYEFVNAVLKGEDKLNYVTVAFLPEAAAGKIEELTGKKVEGSRVVLDINAVRHIEKRHGENGQHDQSMKNVEDIARMGYVIMNYDEISYDMNTTTAYLDENGKPSPLIKMSKRIDGTYYVIEAVNSSKKRRNYVISAYISKRKEQ